MLWIYFVCSSILLQIGSCAESSVAFGARDGKGWGWGSETSSSFFDIALTALAFLSFGIFLLNLLLNALLFPSVTAAAPLTNPDPILTMITGGGGTGGAIITGRSHSHLGKRFRSGRSIFSPEIDSDMSARYLISFVTNSIETMAQKHECLPRLFCDGNRRSRVMGRGFQFIFPVVSVCISYIGKIFNMHEKFEEHLNAIMLGASEANCQKHFPNCKR